jgi:hypothetical protein
VAKWTAEQKQKALAMAEATSLTEAAKATGIPRGTIGRWMAEMKRNNETETSETKRTPQKIKEIAEQATEEAKAEVREYVADRAKQVADDILSMVQQAVAEAEDVIANGPNDDEPKAGWLRAIIGAIAQGVEKYQLMTGKPTNRQALEGQVTQRYEYDITHRIEQYADVYRQLARRGVFRGSDEGDDTGKPLDTT